MSSQDKNAITNNKQEDSSSKDNTQLIFRINMIAYVVLMVIFYGIFVIYAVIPGISTWLSN
ncbi:hypothetical protein I6G91_00795 [Fannyhessea vaginae]|jgi:hypothetical protein|uniref:Uncharacterized protein n=2 Tax=Fannyhessea vaginae TaxID=82135 RepID=F1T484_9ACTN|nr:hypothetical protein [Fannyhessea vaginae]EGF23528.1 hypothetical protein HMPREF0091_10475 [Fannyhessea vaginae DSM 15829]QPR41878.1 hypothetical protein I6G91_00795 [Fannyhessea vaginae]